MKYLECQLKAFDKIRQVCTALHLAKNKNDCKKSCSKGDISFWQLFYVNFTKSKNILRKAHKKLFVKEKAYLINEMKKVEK